MGPPCLTPRLLENQGELWPLIEMENEAEERQEFIQSIQIGKKPIRLRVARIVNHSMDSKAFSISILRIIIEWAGKSYSKL